MASSKGERCGTRYKLQNKIRERGTSPTSRAIQEFEYGQMVHIDIDASLQSGQPNHRFQGYTGKVLGQRGRAYILGIRDGNKQKQVIVLPQHLKPQKSN